ncbi:MAG: hypothetical protein R3232_09840 [Clostridia bacterium]|nr:hypothetical protein [Clostridia bacterium]
MKRITAALAALLLAASLASCGEKETKEPEFGWGNLAGGVYTNEFFGLSIEMSPDYHYLTPQEIVNKNMEANSADEDFVPTDINTIEDLGSEAYVEYVYGVKYKEGEEPGGFNPSIKIYSENLKVLGTQLSKEDYVRNYLDFSEMIFEGGGVGVDVYQLEKPWISERQFAKGTMKIQYENYAMQQSMYAIVKGDYVLVFMIEYITDSERAELESYVEGLQID